MENIMNKLEGIVLRYWKLSNENKLDTFQFERAYDLFRERMKEKLALHGMLTLEDYINYIGKYYDVNVLKEFVYNSYHTDYKDGLKDILKRLFEPRYENFHSRYKNDPVYSKVLSVYNALLQSPSRLGDKVFLMERAISLAHRDGMFINIEELREFYEEEIDRLSLDPVFGVLTRAALELRVRKIQSPFNAVFIDFDNIKTRNEERGYKWVNQSITDILSSLNSPQTLCGRWFSGDEVVFISEEEFESVFIDKLLRLSTKSNPTFKYHFFENQTSINDLERNISVLSRVQSSKETANNE